MPAPSRTRSADPVTDRLVAWRDATGHHDRQVLHALAAAIVDRGVDVEPALVEAVRGDHDAVDLDPSILDGLVRDGFVRDGSGSSTDRERLPSALVGRAHQVLLTSGDRRRRGAFYTPDAIADGVVALARDDGPGGRGDEPARSALATVCDPAAGGGAFLLAAARSLEADGVDRSTIVARRLFGSDIDALAVAITRLALALWAAEGGARADADALARHVVVADALADEEPPVADAPEPGFDLVVGNPPFLNQLEQATARSGASAARARDRFGAAAHRYTDDALLFLVQSCRWIRPGGRVSLLLPESALVAVDGRHARLAVHELAELRAFWWADGPVFAIPVRVCAPVLERRREPGAATVAVTGSSRPIRRRAGPTFAPVTELRDPPAAASWAPLAADLRGHPIVRLRARGTLADLCRATAGFRDQYYGIAPFVVDAAPAPGPDGAGPGRHGRLAPLVTAGLVEPATARWGARPTRFAGRSWVAPVVDLDALERDGDAAVAAWTRARLVPKVVVATQTRVIEAAVDEHGRWFPSVPTIAIEPTEGAAPLPCGPDERLWWIAAALTAPAASAWAFEHHGGAALSADALKLSGRQMLALPLPVELAAWADGAAHVRSATASAREGDEAGWRAALVEAGRALNRAHGLEGAVADEVLDWWRGRLPSWRGARRRAPTAAPAPSP